MTQLKRSKNKFKEVRIKASGKRKQIELINKSRAGPLQKKVVR